MTDTLTVHAPAKINLTLDVLGRRPDGYHDIRSIMQTIALHDTLTITRTPDVPGVRLTVDGSEARNTPADERNSVHKAAVRLQKTAAARGLCLPSDSGLHLHLTKHIPSEAGLGGGSSDAAAALRAINLLLRLNLSPTRLTEIAASLGADVPFFLTGGTALVEGLGERITPLPPLSRDWPLIVIKPEVGMATPAAYASLDLLPQREYGTATDSWLAGRPQAEWLTGNDFEPVVFAALPPVRKVFDLMQETAETDKGFSPRLCGSGSALFLPCPDTDTAQDMANKLCQLRHPDIHSVWATNTQGSFHDR